MKAENPTQIKKGKRGRRVDRVDRGGYWYGSPLSVRASYRGGLAPAIRDDIIGFRLVRNK